MATRGRKPKPTAFKILEENPGKRPLNKGEICTAKIDTDTEGGFCGAKVLKCPTGAAVCPDWLEDEAKAEWERMSKVLEDMGMLTSIDMVAFAGIAPQR